jgi:hypothetical protein
MNMEAPVKKLELGGKLGLEFEVVILYILLLSEQECQFLS